MTDQTQTQPFQHQTGPHPRQTISVTNGYPANHSPEGVALRLRRLSLIQSISLAIVA